MSFVTFVRDYIQDPDRIIHIPNFVFDACKDFVWYIVSFQWFRNLIYVTLSFPSAAAVGSFKQNSTSNAFLNEISTLSESIGQQNTAVNANISSLSLPSSSALDAINTLTQSTSSPQIDLAAHAGLLGTTGSTLLNTYFELPTYARQAATLESSLQMSIFHNSLYGFFNGITSTFHFCAVTILIIHVLLNEDKSRAFKIALASCFGDISYMVAVLFGFTGLVVPWLSLEPLGYILGFSIQFFFALEIIKDNRRIKANLDKQFRTPSVQRRSTYNGTISGRAAASDRAAASGRIAPTGVLSFNRWLIPLLVLFSWCEQTQFFQTGSVFSLQPTSTLLEISGFTKEFQVLIYLFTFIVTRILVTWTCLSIFESLINRFSESKNNNLKNLFTNPIRELFYFYNLLVTLLIDRQAGFTALSNIKRKTINLFYGAINALVRSLSWFVPKGLQVGSKALFPGLESKDMSVQTDRYTTTTTSKARRPEAAALEASAHALGNTLTDRAEGKKIQHLLRDPLAIAAVTCSLAFLPTYSTNLLITKSIGFFPEENRIKHSLLSPWDMPATVLASDMDFISNHPNLAEYPFFLPFYDKGEYGGWLGVGEEDIRYGPFRLWQSRRIRAPWRRTTLQEPALTFANDKSLFIDPLLRTPDLKNSFNDTMGRPIVGRASTAKPETANIKTGLTLTPKIGFLDKTPISQSRSQAPSTMSFDRSATSEARRRTSTTTSFAQPAVEAPRPTAGQAATTTFGREARRPTVEARRPTVDKVIKTKDIKDANYLPSNQTVNSSFTHKWEYFWKQFKTRSAYAKLLAINSSGSMEHVSSTTTSFTRPTLGQAATTTTSKARRPTAGQAAATSGRPTVEDRRPTVETGQAKLPLNNDFKITTLPLFSIGDKASSKATYSIDIASQQLEGAPSTPVKTENSKITKTGRKKIIETLKKPLRKVKTSSFLGLKSFVEDNSLVNSLVPATRHASTTSFAQPAVEARLAGPTTEARQVSTARMGSISNKVTQFSRNIGLTDQELQIKNNKQIRKRFKKFKKKFRIFRTRAYKKRNTKIKRLKHFHYIRNKNKKRRKSRRLIYKLRRQYPYIRNIKERKADIFGLYSPVASLDLSKQNPASSSAQAKIEANIKNQSESQNSILESSKLLFHSTLGTLGTVGQENSKNAAEFTHLKEKPFYSTEYPNKKNRVNVKKDFNLTFRTQIGERLDFAQEEIRARIFMNPYVRFLLSNRIDNFASRSNGINSSKAPQVAKLTIVTELNKDSNVNGTKGINDTGTKPPVVSPKIASISGSTESNYSTSFAPRPIDSAAKTEGTTMLTVDSTREGGLKENDLFKRRLIISKYADAVDFLKPSLQHSYADRVYNHQFKGTLSTARRLFSLKVQYDRPLVHDLSYKSAIEHEGLLSPLENKPSLLEKGYSAPLYAAWDPQLRKLILTNRYLNHKTVTTLASSSGCEASSTCGGLGASSARVESKNNESVVSSTKSTNFAMYHRPTVGATENSQVLTHGRIISQPQLRAENDFIVPGSSATLRTGGTQAENQTDLRKNLIQFTNWPLKESYFKDNEFLVSQLYSNSQPIDSFLSQENEKARPVALPRRVNSFNTILNYKNNVQPTDAQRSQQFLKIESNDKKTFLFKHLWNSSSTASGFHSIGAKISSVLPNSLARQGKNESLTSKSNKVKDTDNNLALHNQAAQFSFAPSTNTPTSAEQRKANRMEEREYPLWMVLRTLPPNQGGFLWPGD